MTSFQWEEAYILNDFLNVPSSVLFSIISGIFKQTLQISQQIDVKNAYPASSCFETRAPAYTF